jgi:hypothetical protein
MNRKIILARDVSGDVLSGRVIAAHFLPSTSFLRPLPSRKENLLAAICPRQSGV